MQEKDKRIKYIRALEKFAKNSISILKKENFVENDFLTRIKKNMEVLRKVDPVYLDSPYTKSLENFVNLHLEFKDRQELLKTANLLQKLKNNKHKKDKHKNKFKEDM